MKIFEVKEVCDISEIALGECFRMDGELYVRVECEYDNASVNLTTGVLTHDEPDKETTVEPVHAELRIVG